MPGRSSPGPRSSAGHGPLLLEDGRLRPAARNLSPSVRPGTLLLVPARTTRGPPYAVNFPTRLPAFLPPPIQWGFGVWSARDSTSILRTVNSPDSHLPTLGAAQLHGDFFFLSAHLGAPGAQLTFPHFPQSFLCSTASFALYSFVSGRSHFPRYNPLWSLSAANRYSFFHS